MLGTEEPPGDPLQPDRAVECSDGDLELWPEVMQVPAQSLLVLRAGFGEVLAMIEQQLDLQRGLVQMGGGEGVYSLAQGGSGDSAGVDWVGLPTSTLRSRVLWR